MTEFQEIVDAVMERVGSTCVSYRECELKNGKMYDVLHSIDTRLSVIEASTAKRDKYIVAAATAVIGSIVALFGSVVFWAVKSGAL